MFLKHSRNIMDTNGIHTIPMTDYYIYNNVLALKLKCNKITINAIKWLGMATKKKHTENQTLQLISSQKYTRCTQSDTKAISSSTIEWVFSFVTNSNNKVLVKRFYSEKMWSGCASHTANRSSVPNPII